MTSLQITLLVVSLIAVLVIIPFIWVIVTNNSFNKLKNEIENAQIVLNTTIVTFYEVFIKTFKECLKKNNLNENDYESLLKIASPKLDDLFDLKQQFVFDFLKIIEKTIAKVSENQIIKNSQEFKECLKRTNDEIEALHTARRVYNAFVSYFNQKRITFPHKIIANMRRFTNYSFFETELP